MKKFKKIITVATASLMAVSVCALTACDGGGYGSKASNEAAEKVVEQFAAQKGQSVTLEGSLTQNNATTNVKADVNYGSGNADVFVTEKDVYHYMFVRDWKVYVAEDSKTEITDFSSVALELAMDIKATVEEELNAAANLIFTQVSSLVNQTLSAYNGFLISYAKAANAVMYKNNTLTIDYNLAAYNMYNDIKSVVDGLTIETTVGDILGNANIKKYMQVFTELITVQELNAVVDMVKTLINETPTLPDDPADPPAINNPANTTPSEEEGPQYPEEALPDDSGDTEYPATPDYSETVAALGGAIEMLDGLLDAVKPEAGSTTYDYLVKLIASDELKEQINAAIGGTVITKNLTEYTVGDLLALAANTTDKTLLNKSLEQVQKTFGAFSEYFTKEAITAGNVSVSGVLLTYTVNSDFKVLSQTFAAAVTVNSETVSGEFTLTYNNADVTLKSVNVQ